MGALEEVASDCGLETPIAHIAVSSTFSLPQPLYGCIELDGQCDGCAITYRNVTPLADGFRAENFSFLAPVVKERIEMLFTISTCERTSPLAVLPNELLFLVC